MMKDKAEVEVEKERWVFDNQRIRSRSGDILCKSD